MVRLPRRGLDDVRNLPLDHILEVHIDGAKHQISTAHDRSMGKLIEISAVGDLVGWPLLTLVAADASRHFPCRRLPGIGLPHGLHRH